MKLGLKARLSILVVGLSLVLVLGLSAVMVAQFDSTIAGARLSNLAAMREALMEHAYGEALGLADSAAAVLVNSLYRLDLQAIGKYAQSTLAQHRVTVVEVFDRRGRLIHDGSSNLADFDRLIDDAHVATMLASGQTRTWVADNALHVAVPVLLEQRLLGGIRVGLSLAAIQRDIAATERAFAEINAEVWRRLLADVGIAILVLSLLGVAIGMIVARSLSRPIEALVGATRRLGAGRYDVELPFRRSDEIGELGDALAAMARARKAVEEQLRAAKEEAERASRAKSEFLSAMSHELRTPMNAILGFAQLLQQDRTASLGPEPREYVEYILHAGRHLLELIEDILDLSRVESGKVTLLRDRVALRDAIDECLALVDGLAAERRIAIVDTTAPLPLPELWVDRMRLKQVLLNLLTNAIKYNRDQGQVSLAVREGDAGRVRIEVSDSGRGIPKERAGEVFQPFSRLGVEGTRIEGTGIGLAVTRQLVELMGGAVGFVSESGVGTTFWVELPASRAPLAPSARVPPAEPGASTVERPFVAAKGGG